MSKKTVRINDRIRISPVRLIGADGEQVGIIPVREALDRARDLGLDLVEVSPNSRPPVCRIMDYGKYKYELAKKDKVAKKKAHAFQLKEMRFRPKIDEHDYQFKAKHVREFLESGSKVRAFVLFRGREMTRQEWGRKVLLRLEDDLSEIATVDSPPKMEGRSMSMVMSPRSEVVKAAQAAKTKRAEDKIEEKDRERALEGGPAVEVDERVEGEDRERELENGPAVEADDNE